MPDRVVALEARKPEAKGEDDEALAAALRAGKPDPGPKAQQELEAGIESARREVTDSGSAPARGRRLSP
jgi:hypothetical protein